MLFLHRITSTAAPLPTTAFFCLRGSLPYPQHLPLHSYIAPLTALTLPAPLITLTAVPRSVSGVLRPLVSLSNRSLVPSFPLSQSRKAASLALHAAQLCTPPSRASLTLLSMALTSKNSYHM